MRIRQVEVLDRNAFYLVGTVSYITLCLNPFIYASRYEVFRRYLKQMLNKNSATPGNTASGSTTKPTQPTNVTHR